MRPCSYRPLFDTVLVTSLVCIVVAVVASQDRDLDARVR
jgi:hypothetical protein